MHFGLFVNLSNLTPFKCRNYCQRGVNCYTVKWMKSNNFWNVQLSILILLLFYRKSSFIRQVAYTWSGTTLGHQSFTLKSTKDFQPILSFLPYPILGEGAKKEREHLYGLVPCFTISKHTYYYIRLWTDMRHAYCVHKLRHHPYTCTHSRAQWHGG